MKRLASIACALTLVLCASMAQAEIFMGIMPNDSIADIKRKFPNATFEDIRPAWLQDEDRLIKIEGGGLGGTIVVRATDDRAFWKYLFDSQDCNNAQKRETPDCIRWRYLATGNSDEFHYVESVKFIPIRELKAGTIIKRYGKPDEVDINETFTKYICWDVGVCAIISDTEPLNDSVVSAVEYRFTDSDMEKWRKTKQQKIKPKTESSMQIGQGSRRE